MRRLNNKFVHVGIVAVILGSVVFAAVGMYKTDDDLTDAAPASSVISETVSLGFDSGVNSEPIQQSTAPTMEAMLTGLELQDSGKTLYEVDIRLTNNSDEVLQFSPPIDVFFKSDIGKNYQLESNVSTTLFGGPIEPGSTTEGKVFVLVDGSEESLQLVYQPNNSSQSVLINL